MDKDAVQKRYFGRGSPFNPGNRFEENRVEKHIDITDDWEEKKTSTQFITDHSKSILSWNASPDIPYRAGINPYRGCEHGCVYCFARPSHEYLGYSSGLDFETKIHVKPTAAKLLQETFQKKSWQPQPIALSGNTDPYQPIERKLKITRSLLEVFSHHRNPVVMITKNKLILRDLDHLRELAKYACVHVYLSINSLNPKLARVLEPRASSPHDRLETLRTLNECGVPASVLVAPIIPGLSDHELPRVLEAAKRASARSAGYVTLRLPYQNKDIFIKWLDDHFPLRKEKILKRIRDMHGGKLYEADFGSRKRGKGIFADINAQVFEKSIKRLKLDREPPALSISHFRRIQKDQLNFLEDIKIL